MKKLFINQKQIIVKKSEKFILHMSITIILVLLLVGGLNIKNSSIAEMLLHGLICSTPSYYITCCIYKYLNSK